MNGSAANGSERGARLALLLLLVPALTGLWIAWRIASVAVPFAASGEDPLLTTLLGREESGSGVDRRLQAAADADALDFRYPYWLGERVWFGSDGKERDWNRSLHARELFLRAAERCPTLAEARLYLSEVSARLGRTEEADAQALAALELAPLQRSLTRRVQAWFATRYRQTRREEHLVACLKAGEPGDDTSVELLSIPLLTYEETARLLGLTGLPVARQVDLLERGGRWEWALRRLGEMGDGTEVDLRRGLRERYGKFLLARGRADAALEQFAAAVADGESGFGAWSARGAALLLTGQPEEGRASLARAIREGESPASVREALRGARAPDAERTRFWEARVAEHGAQPALVLEAGRAWQEAGEATRAEKTLRPILDDAEVGAEANWILARMLAKAGSPAMARKYAERAVAMDPENREYVRLLENLKRSGR